MNPKWSRLETCLPFPIFPPFLSGLSCVYFLFVASIFVCDRGRPWIGHPKETFWIKWDPIAPLQLILQRPSSLVSTPRSWLAFDEPVSAAPTLSVHVGCFLNVFASIGRLLRLFVRWLFFFSNWWKMMNKFGQLMILPHVVFFSTFLVAAKRLYRPLCLPVSLLALTFFELFGLLPCGDGKPEKRENPVSHPRKVGDGGDGRSKAE